MALWFLRSCLMLSSMFSGMSSSSERIELASLALRASGLRLWSRWSRCFLVMTRDWMPMWRLRLLSLNPSPSIECCLRKLRSRRSRPRWYCWAFGTPWCFMWKLRTCCWTWIENCVCVCMKKLFYVESANLFLGMDWKAYLCVWEYEKETFEMGGKPRFYTPKKDLNHRIQFLLKNGTRSRGLRSLMLPWTSESYPRNGWAGVYLEEELD